MKDISWTILAVSFCLAIPVPERRGITAVVPRQALIG